MKYRVVQCFTGAVGSAVIRLAVRDPRVAIVGLLVHHADKEGVDAGELAGIGPIGVRGTRNLDRLLRAGADCAIWNGAWDARSIVKILRSGINVYSGNHAYFLEGQPDFDVLDSACREGGTTLAAGGNIPGLISDVAPLFLSGYSGQITQVRCWQRNHVPDLPSSHDLTDGVGFGLPIEIGAAPDSPIDRGWEGALRQSAHMVATGLGVPLDGFSITSKEFAAAPQHLLLEPSGLTVPEGHAAGIRWKFTGLTGDRPFYEMNVEMTVGLHLGPGWRSRVDQPNWRIEIDGSPSLMAEITVQQPAGPGIIELNAARAVNMVSRVVEAPVGCHSILDVPAAVGSGAGPQ
jgi:2,4-diaminopentanoate dehydrogenase